MEGKLAVIVTDGDIAVYTPLIVSLSAELENSEDWEELLEMASAGQGEANAPHVYRTRTSRCIHRGCTCTP
jgi:hypothetical protein